MFSAKVPGADGIESRAEWYVIGTNIFEALAYLAAGILCLRNWLSQQIVSGRNVWLLIGLGMLSYFVGGIIFGYTEIVLKDEPDVSVGDIFFVLSYLLLGAGMILAVASRRINLEKWQWLIVLAIAVFGSLLAWWISMQQETPSELLVAILNWFYVVSDVVLLIIATTLLLAFWGGRVSQSWRMIAAAAFSLYIADMWFKYAQGPNYQSGEILEVFWVFSGVLFGMGAVLEYDASLRRTRRTSGRKRA
ncbi:DNA-binding response regulator, OmpR family, containings REC and winged-helix [Nostoc flagelliforme CCNUN1]|uniref:DNA-binding response regulator, OmpR family, containings REC and winged-helix n=1 Tax=Nostoc flagelliforme CCNUN1 TaxID=2038116 RepID=A0A2K8SMF0_9NOSO|nr:DNA-binding response regulator, OmpR family, containings REC and winged-helix [Nostoc flagelliforme CCNUN1]